MGININEFKGIKPRNRCKTSQMKNIDNKGFYSDNDESLFYQTNKGFPGFLTKREGNRSKDLYSQIGASMKQSNIDVKDQK